MGKLVADIIVAEVHESLRLLANLTPTPHRMVPPSRPAAALSVDPFDCR
jgi:hypothetical protein